MPGIGLNPSQCCCGSDCTIRIRVTQCGFPFSYGGRIRVSKTGFSTTVTVSPGAFVVVSIPSPGSYLVESLDEPPDRHAPLSQSINVIVCGSTHAVTFPVAAGYLCPPCWPYDPLAPPTTPYQPIPLTIMGTNSFFGSCEMTYDPIQEWYFGSKTVTFPASTRDPSGYICPETTGTLEYRWYQSGGLYSACVFGVTAVRPFVVTCSTTTPEYNSHGVNTGALFVAGVRTGDPFFISITVVSGIKAALYGNYDGTITFTLSE